MFPTSPDRTINTSDLIDSGSAKNLISHALSSTLKIPVSPCLVPIARWIASYCVGNHHPSDWPVHTGAAMAETPQQTAIQTVTTTAVSCLFESPQWQGHQHSYWISFYPDVFSPQRASQLPLHRLWDCAIDLSQGFPLPRGESILSLTLSRRWWSNTSPGLHTSFYFSGGFKLHLCCGKGGWSLPMYTVDYRVFPIKFNYPLPLVPTTLELLRRPSTPSSIFAVHIIWSGFKRGTSGTMNFRWCRMAWSIFLANVNKVLWNFHQCLFIVCIDNILIYSSSFNEYLHHVKQVVPKTPSLS